MTRLNFVIHTGSYNPLIGGSIALHKLAHNLELCGEKAYLYTDRKNHEWLGTQINTVPQLDALGSYVVIYGETIPGNPLNARKVVRWLLSSPGHVGKDRTGSWSASDMIVAYTGWYARKTGCSELLTAYDWRFADWGDDGGVRSGECALMRKGRPKIIGGIPANTIDGYRTNLDLRRAFNKYKTLRSYDTQTMISLQAVLCGCESVVVPDEDLSAKTWREMFPYFQYGVAYGENDLEYARDTVQFVPEYLSELEKVSMSQTKTFIEKTKERFL